MIRKLIYPLLAIVLLSSCAGKFSLQKRKYTKGFYFASAKNNSVKEECSKISHTKAKPVEVEIAKEEIVTASVSNITANSKLPVSPPDHTTSKQTQSTQSNKQIVASANKTVLESNKTFKKIDLSAINTKTKRDNYYAGRKGESGAKLIVMVILCFFWFINLIPVYVHDNGITLNFWVTLLLDLTYIGGVIFALLVVLDIVDLK